MKVKVGIKVKVKVKARVKAKGKVNLHLSRPRVQVRKFLQKVRPQQLQRGTKLLVADKLTQHDHVEEEALSFKTMKRIYHQNFANKSKLTWKL